MLYYVILRYTMLYYVILCYTVYYPIMFGIFILRTWESAASEKPAPSRRSESHQIGQEFLHERLKRRRLSSDELQMERRDSID